MRRFTHFVETGDDSNIPGDLTRIKFKIVRPLFTLHSPPQATSDGPSSHRACEKVLSRIGVLSETLRSTRHGTPNKALPRSLR